MEEGKKMESGMQMLRRLTVAGNLKEMEKGTEMRGVGVEKTGLG